MGDPGSHIGKMQGLGDRLETAALLASTAWGRAKFLCSRREQLWAWGVTAGIYNYIVCANDFLGTANALLQAANKGKHNNNSNPCVHGIIQLLHSRLTAQHSWSSPASLHLNTSPSQQAQLRWSCTELQQWRLQQSLQHRPLPNTAARERGGTPPPTERS